MAENRKRFGICLGVVAAALGIGGGGFIPAQAGAASSAAAPPVRTDVTQDDIAALAAWATRYGHKLILRGDVAKLVGLSHGEAVDATGVSYANKTGLKIFYAVVPGSRQTVMARSDDKIALFGSFPTEHDRPLYMPTTKRRQEK